MIALLLSCQGKLVLLFSLIARSCLGLTSILMCRYIPSEVLNGKVTDLQKADMFMLGITLYELTTCMDLPTGTQQPVHALLIVLSHHFMTICQVVLDVAVCQ